MPKKDVLKVEFERVFDSYAFRISYQNTEILERGEFNDKELGVFSRVSPAFDIIDNKVVELFLRGNKEQYDKRIMICTKEEKQLIEEKVRQINEKYGIIEDWTPEIGEEMYYISFFSIPSNCKINKMIYINNINIDDNMFRTKEIAEECLKKIVEVMKEYRNKEV